MRNEQRVLAEAWLPLSRALICLDDETIFDRDFAQCPVCQGSVSMPLATWLGTIR
jgi:hypothetical protein